MTEPTGHVTYLWVFNGRRNYFPSALFASKKDALKWIANNSLTGTLTKYPIDIPVYDWAIERGYFTPKHEKHRASEFISNFSNANQDHEHFLNGVAGDMDTENE